MLKRNDDMTEELRVCLNCFGNGRVPRNYDKSNEKWIECPVCKGSGKVKKENDIGDIDE